LLKSSYFRRLLLPYLALICAVTLAIALLGAVWLRDAYLSQRRLDLHNTLSLVCGNLRDPLARKDGAALAAAVAEIGTTLNCRVTVIAEDEAGTVLADNEAVPASMGSHRFRPEVIQARDSGEGWEVRTSGTLHEELLYHARKLTLPDGRIVYIRLAVHTKVLAASLRVFYGGIAFTALCCLGIAGAISYRLAQRQVAPVLEVTAVAEAIASGQLDHRILKNEPGELGQLARSLNRMADSFTQLLAKARSDQAKLETILAGMSEGIIVIDSRRYLSFANDAAARLLHLDEKTLTGRPVWEVLREQSLLAALDAAPPQRRRLHLGPIDGRQIELTVCPLTGEGSGAGFILVLHDITETVRYQELRKEFVANVSHELRTPLTVIRGFIEMLRDGAIDDAKRRENYLCTIDRNAQQLANLVNDLLELSRLESQPGLGKQAPISLAPLVQRVADFMRPAAEKRAHRLTLELLPLSPSIMGRADYIERAVINLLDNAIKYTPEGGSITVRVSATDKQAQIDVADNGVGISLEDQSRIFERFYRVERSRSRDMGGTGLGLAIVKHIATAHGGSVSVQSEPGKGSTFRLHLPLAQ